MLQMAFSASVFLAVCLHVQEAHDVSSLVARGSILNIPSITLQSWSEPPRESTKQRSRKVLSTLSEIQHTLHVKQEIIWPYIHFLIFYDYYGIMH